MAGTLDANRLQYGTNVDALTANSKYTVELPNFDFEQARIQADTAGDVRDDCGHNLPRVTAQTTYKSNQLQFTARFEEQTRSLGARRQRRCFIPITTSCTCGRSISRWGRRSGRCRPDAKRQSQYSKPTR